MSFQLISNSTFLATFVTIILDTFMNSQYMLFNPLLLITLVITFVTHEFNTLMYKSYALLNTLLQKLYDHINDNQKVSFMNDSNVLLQFSFPCSVVTLITIIKQIFMFSLNMNFKILSLVLPNGYISEITLHAVTHNAFSTCQCVWLHIHRG